VFTQEVRDRLIRAKRTGCPDWVAAQSAGISRTTFYELRKRARAEEAGPYRELLEAIERAEAEAYLRAMALLHREMDTPGNFRAALAYVDRVDRGRFSAPRAPEHDAGAGADSEEQRLDLAALSEDQLAYLERLYEPADEEREEER